MEYLNGIEKIQKGVSGIYKITNLKNGKCYIGQSKDILRRVKCHHLCSYNNKNSESYNFQIYQAIRKYGIENFTIEIVEECHAEMLDERETYWIQLYDSMKNGYNATGGGKRADQLYSSKARQKSIKTQKERGSLRGEKHPMAKLTNEQVVDIRNRYIDGERIASIYNDYKNTGMALSSFEEVIHGRSYKYTKTIPKDVVIKQRRERYKQGPISKEVIIAIKKEFQEKNCTYTSLGTKYGLNKERIRCIITGKTYKNYGETLTENEVATYKSHRHPGRISEETIKNVRSDYVNTDCNNETLAEKYNISAASISDIIRGKTYTWVDGYDDGYCKMALDKKQNTVLGKISEDIVVAVRKEHRQTLCSYEYLAKKYGLNSSAMVASIVLGETYRYYDGIPSDEEVKLFKKTHCQRKISDNDVISIRKKYNETKCSYASLANEYGISRKTVEKIVKRLSHKDVG